jgi:flagellar hook-length control protein FliK
MDQMSTTAIDTLLAIAPPESAGAAIASPASAASPAEPFARYMSPARDQATPAKANPDVRPAAAPAHTTESQSDSEPVPNAPQNRPQAHPQAQAPQPATEPDQLQTNAGTAIESPSEDEDQEELPTADAAAIALAAATEPLPLPQAKAPTDKLRAEEGKGASGVLASQPTQVEHLDQLQPARPAPAAVRSKLPVDESVVPDLSTQPNAASADESKPSTVQPPRGAEGLSTVERPAVSESSIEESPVAPKSAFPFDVKQGVVGARETPEATEEVKPRTSPTADRQKRKDRPSVEKQEAVLLTATEDPATALAEKVPEPTARILAISPSSQPSTSLTEVSSTSTATTAPSAAASTPTAPPATPAAAAMVDGRIWPQLAARHGAPDTRTPALTSAEQVRLVQRVARAFEAAQHREGELLLRLSPPRLGSLKLEIKVKEGVLAARIEVETAAAQSAIVENLSALRERLIEQGVQIERFDVELPGRQGEEHSRQSWRDDRDHAAPRLARDPGSAREQGEHRTPVLPEQPTIQDGRLNVTV